MTCAAEKLEGGARARAILFMCKPTFTKARARERSFHGLEADFPNLIYMSEPVSQVGEQRRRASPRPRRRGERIYALLARICAAFGRGPGDFAEAPSSRREAGREGGAY